MTSKTKTVIHWFRKGLRIHDNPALIDAIDEAKSKKYYLRPVFVLDPLIIKWLRVGPNRWRFLQQSLDDLNKQLKKIGSRLYVVRGKPDEVFTRVFKEWNVSLITFEQDIEPYSKERDAKIEKIAKEFKIEVIQRISHTIYYSESIIAKNFGKPPLTYQKFLSIAESLGKTPTPLDAPDTLPEMITKPVSDECEKKNINCYDPPTLEELGVDETALSECLYPGGETEGLNRLEMYMKKTDWVCKFEKPNTSPNSLEPSTTVLSPYVKFGCLSSRLFYKRVKDVIKSKPHSKPPVSLIGQLMWREFYYAAGAATPNFDKMVGNPVCYQIPWGTNDQHLQAWKYGKTGYPFIDAIMRQLRQEGWIHHLARHAVACFLTRGDLWISWEEGQKVFEEWLLDADWALNAGNWMWLSASAFFHQFFRVYSPIAFGKKTDKTGEYIRKYVPEVKKFPPDYIYEPWEAPLSVQKAAGCILGKDYPKRIVIHEEVRQKNITKMALAYKENKKNREEKDEEKGEKRKGKNASGSTSKKLKKGQTSLDKFVKKK